MFRDESTRTEQKARRSYRRSIRAAVLESLEGTASSRTFQALAPYLAPTNVQYPLSQPMSDLGANFFFAKYSFHEEPFFDGYHAWLADSYLEAGPRHVLSAAIAAVGLAGLSNLSATDTLESKSKEQYCTALTALKEVLNDPDQIVADSTLMAVILLILFEVIREGCALHEICL